MSETLRLPQDSQTLSATHPIASAQNILRPPRKTHGSLTECSAGHGILRRYAIPKIGAAPQRERSFEERSVSCKALARKTTAMALELRLSKRRSLTRQEDITARRPCHQKTHFALKKPRLHEPSSKNTSPASQRFHQKILARTSQTVTPCPKRNVNGTTVRRTCSSANLHFVRNCRTENTFLRTG